MDNLISSLESLTESVTSRLQEITYEELELFIEQRQQIIDEINVQKIQQSYTQEQFERLNRIVQNDTHILGRMSTLKTEASNWLQQREQAKVRRNAYEAAYSPDSLLMDRRE